MSSVVCSSAVARMLVDLEAAYGGEQVGAEGDVGPPAALEHAEHLDEGLGDEVLGVTGRHELAGEAAGGVDVALEERAVGIDVPAADRRDQLGVPRCLDAGGDAHVLGRSGSLRLTRLPGALDCSPRERPAWAVQAKIRKSVVWSASWAAHGRPSHR